ncbi:MAG: TlpA disulfide reductase family protein [Bacteroidota bacterium]
MNYFLKNKKAVFIISFIILLYANLFSRGIHDHGIIVSFYLTGVFNFVLCYVMLKVNPYKKVGTLLTYFYFYLITPAVIYGFWTSSKMPGIIDYIIYVFSSLFAYLWYRYNNKNIIITYIIIFAIIAFNYLNILNFYYDYMDKNRVIGKELPRLNLIDKSSNKIKLPKGKVLVFDVWNNYCGICINEMPIFESLKNEFKNDKEVVFYGLNAVIRKGDIKNSLEDLKEFSFENFYIDNDELKNKLNIDRVPQYLVINKKGIIVYIGSLNSNKTETYNNIYDLINEAKK